MATEKPDKYDFDSSGEALAYVSLEQARVLAMKHAQNDTEFYGSDYQGLKLVWEVISQEEGEDYYDIRLSFRPAGRYSGEPGVDHFIIDKTGNIELRQMLNEPTDIPSPLQSPGPAFIHAIGELGWSSWQQMVSKNVWQVPTTSGIAEIRATDASESAWVGSGGSLREYLVRRVTDPKNQMCPYEKDLVEAGYSLEFRYALAESRPQARTWKAEYILAYMAEHSGQQPRGNRRR